jgi:hypothetical protein
MPVGAVAVTEGSGKNLHTWQRSVSSVNREEQYIQIGESGLATYNLCYAGAVSTATGDSHILQLMSGSSTYTRVHRITVEQSANATTATLLAVAVYRLSSAGTGGTAVTPRPFDTGDTANATGMILPTAKGTETVELMRTVIIMRQAVGTTTTQPDDFWIWQQQPGKKPLIIPSGTANGIAVKNLSAVAAGSLVVNIEFTETAWL